MDVIADQVKGRLFALPADDHNLYKSTDYFHRTWLDGPSELGFFFFCNAIYFSSYF